MALWPCGCSGPELVPPPARQVLLPGAAGAGAAEDGDWVYQRSAADMRAEVLAAQRRREQDSVRLGPAQNFVGNLREALGRLA